MNKKLMRSIHNIPVTRGVPLTREQEFRLFKDHKPVTERRKSRLKERLNEREKHIADVLIRTNTTMVREEARLSANICRSYYRVFGHVDTKDFVQEGHLGQISAMERFDPSRGYRFKTYGKRWVREFLIRYAGMEQARRKTNSTYLREIMKIRYVIADFEAKDRKPTLIELSERTGMKEDKIKRLMTLWMGMESTTKDHDGEVLDMLARTPGNGESPEDAAAKYEIRRMLNEVLDGLPPQDRDILRRRFGWYRGNEESLEEIGQSYELTRERVRQLEVRAMERLRRRINGGLDGSVLELYK